MARRRIFALIILLSTLGYILLGWSPFDALYMVIITVFSVGYGEIQPVDSPAERVWTMIVILGGWSGGVVPATRLSRFRARDTSSTSSGATWNGPS